MGIPEDNGNDNTNVDAIKMACISIIFTIF